MSVVPFRGAFVVLRCHSSPIFARGRIEDFALRQNSLNANNRHRGRIKKVADGKIKVKLGEGPGDVVRFRHPYGSVTRLPNNDGDDAVGGIIDWAGPSVSVGVMLGDIVDVYGADGVRHRGRVAGLGDVVPAGGGASRFDLLHYVRGGRCLRSSPVVGRQLEINISRSDVRVVVVERASDSKDWTWTIGRPVSLRLGVGGDGNGETAARSGVITAISSDRKMCKVAFGGGGAGRSVACYPDALAGLLEAARTTLEKGGRIDVEAPTDGTARSEPPGIDGGKPPDGGRALASQESRGHTFADQDEGMEHEQHRAAAVGAVDIAAAGDADGKPHGKVEMTAAAAAVEADPNPENREETASQLRERLRHVTDERDALKARLGQAEAERDGLRSRLEEESAGRARDRSERDGAEAERARVHQQQLDRIWSVLDAARRDDGREDVSRVPPSEAALRAELTNSMLKGYRQLNEITELRSKLDELRRKSS